MNKPMRNIELFNILQSERDRQKQYHNFIASENFASNEVMYYVGSEFSNKYTEGYPSKRYYNGCINFDLLENLGIKYVTDLYECSFANIQPHSGASANLAIYKAFLQPGDTVLGMDLSAGGHLSHGSPVNISGKWFDNQFYGVGDDGWLDYDYIQQRAEETKPKLIIAGASAYPRQIDFKRFRDIANSVNAYLLVDMAHYSGLIAGKSYDSPLPYADFVTSTTHKTLRAARGGMILWNSEEYTKKINMAVFPGTQGGALMNQVAGKVQGYYEALQPEFSQYTDDVVNTAKTMSDIFIENRLNVLTNGTDSHMVIVETGEKSGEEVADILEQEHKIIVNKNSIPNDPRGVWETSGIRLGTAAMVTTKGGGTHYFKEIANTICDVILS
jgi:glycine hydroxymethyltransferase